MLADVSWEFIAMIIGVAALASASITEIVKKFIQQAVIERRPGREKPFWRGTVLRLTSVISGGFFGWMLLPESARLGLILGIGAGSVTTESVGLVKRILDRKNGSSGEPKDRGGKRSTSPSDFGSAGQETEFAKALDPDDLEP